MELAVFVEQLRRFVAPEPIFQDAQMAGIVGDIGHRHLMRTPSTFNRLAIYFFRTRPTFRSTKDEHGPARTIQLGILASPRLDGVDSLKNFIERRRHRLMRIM